METRSTQSEYRTEGNTLTGYAAVWDRPTSIREQGRTFTEVVRAGAFARSLASGRDIVASFNHSAAMPGVVPRLLGRTSSGTLRVEEDTIGLRFTLDLPQSAADIKELVERGDLSGASFTFNVKRDKWSGSARELLDVELFELGPVISPAYKDTSIALRSATPLLTLAKYKLELYTRL